MAGKKDKTPEQISKRRKIEVGANFKYFVSLISNEETYAKDIKLCQKYSL